jgi:predicted lipoprotein
MTVSISRYAIVTGLVLQALVWCQSCGLKYNNNTASDEKPREQAPDYEKLLQGSENGDSAPEGVTTNTDSSQGGTQVLAKRTSADVMRHLGPNVIYPRVRDFTLQSTKLKSAIQNLCQGDAGDMATHLQKRVQAQALWLEAMGLWQEIEMMQVGPLVQGDLPWRGRIYSWPEYNNTCGIDQEINKLALDRGDYQFPGHLQPALIGLHALEYVLYKPQLHKICGRSGPPEWQTLTEQQQVFATCRYGLGLADRLVTDANALNALWDPEQVNVSELLSQGTLFNSDQALLNHLTDALSYFEKTLVESKLASPLGILQGCVFQLQPGGREKLCSSLVENVWSQSSFASLARNLSGLYAYFTGTDLNPGGLILEESQATPSLSLLTRQETGGGELAQSIENSIISLYAEVTQLGSDKTLAQLSSELESPPPYDSITDCDSLSQGAEACSLFKNTKKAGRLLRDDLVRILKVELPKQSAGDTD